MNDKPSAIPRGTSAGNERTGLYVLCYEKLPMHRKVTKNRKGEVWHGLDIEKISAEIGVSKQKISMWMKQNGLPGQRMKALIDLEGSKLTFESLGPYINSR